MSFGMWSDTDNSKKVTLTKQFGDLFSIKNDERILTNVSLTVFKIT